MDLSQLNAMLAGLGPWGILIGVGLTFLVQWLKGKQGQPVKPDQPDKQDTPLLDALLALLKLKLAKPAPDPKPASKDIDDDTLHALFGAVAPKKEVKP